MPLGDSVALGTVLFSLQKPTSFFICGYQIISPPTQQQQQKRRPSGGGK